MPIPLPSGVSAKLDGNRVQVSGPRGQMAREFHANMAIELDNNTLTVKRPNDNRENKALHGLTRALLANMVTGVSTGFTRRLVIDGVGYRVEQAGKDLTLLVGYSHPVPVVAPEGITLTAEASGRIVAISGNDKQTVGEVAAKIRAVRPPEPYLGKGIHYEDEVVRRKAGKAGRAGGKK
jgi:large subunit ribosomal protein L6